ncbi:MAG: hypothetical protein K6E10_08325 [Eubacterium sp.]|nr:hypothetical protein [Eubacterium sp.]
MGDKNYKKKIAKLLKEREKQEEEEKKAKELIARSRETVPNQDFKTKSTKLAFFKKYYTYQAFLELYSSQNLCIEEVYYKTILYIMGWFKSRFEDGFLENSENLRYLVDDYPIPEKYKDFNFDRADNINGFSFIDFETAFIDEKKTWLVRLVEPDNHKERDDVKGRVFTTEIFVSRLDDSVALGIRESCKEPDTNIDDAQGFRPSFVRSLFCDKDIIISEFGIDKEYAFAKKPIMLNGKSGQECQRIYNNLIGSDKRQMPVIFIPYEYYEANEIGVDRRTESMLGFAHVVVWKDTCFKLFSQTMNSEELAEVAGEGQVIYYRTTNKQEYPSIYYEKDNENLLKEIKNKGLWEPCRKNFNFEPFIFKPVWWDIDKLGKSQELEENKGNISHAYEMEISQISNQLEELKRDNSLLQKKNDGLENEIIELEKTQNKLLSDIGKNELRIDGLKDKVEKTEKELYKAKAELLKEEKLRKGIFSNATETYMPLFNMPFVTVSKKDELIEWIEKYYSEELLILPEAIKSLNDDNRPIDFHKLCMMIHYIAGYTRYRNDGGEAAPIQIGREYDPEQSGYKVEFVSSGQGATDMYKDSYTIRYYGKKAIMDLHIKVGKGLDFNMIRIYFYYDPDMKKSIIGYMPGHLPTRKSSH